MKRDTVMTPAQIAEHNADIVSRLQASQEFVQSGLTEKPQAGDTEKPAARKPAARKRNG